MTWKRLVQHEEFARNDVLFIWGVGGTVDIPQPRLCTFWIRGANGKQPPGRPHPAAGIPQEGREGEFCPCHRSPQEFQLLTLSRNLWEGLTLSTGRVQSLLR